MRYTGIQEYMRELGKTEEEIEYALNSGILMFNAESSQELARIDEIAGRMGRRAPVAIRVNPDIDPKTHPYVSTGLRENKFGIDFNLALKEYTFAKGLSHLEIIGVDCHIGSQLIELQPFVEALRRLKELVHALGQRDADRCEGSRMRPAYGFQGLFPVLFPGNFNEPHAISQFFQIHGPR